MVGERRFVHEYVKKGVLGEFERALAEEGNKGKGDKDIFDALTQDKDYFASMNPPAAPDMGSIGAGAVDTASARAIMGLKPEK